MIEKLYNLMFAMTAPRDDEKGATAVEYGLLVALIAAVIVAAVVLLGNEVLAGFNKVSAQLPDA